MIWEKQTVDAEKVREISRTHEIDLLSAAIFARRGITGGTDLLYFLESDLRHLHNPFLFNEMEDAVDRILLARSEGERVFVYGDRDVDGITGITILVDTLVGMGLEVSWGVPLGDEPYGLTESVVERVAAEDITLIIAVDCGTTNAGEIRRAAELGVDTIVVDHHNAVEELPPAVALLNPKLEEEAYPFAGLAGCGVAAKLRWALAFSRTDFYKERVCLLNIRPGNGTYEIEAVKLENLVEVDRIVESLVPGVVKFEQTRLFGFVSGLQVITYDAPAQERMLAELFGSAVEAHMLDLAPEIWKVYPRFENRSLMRMQGASRLSRYHGSTPGEIDILVALFGVFVHSKAPVLEEMEREVLDLVAIGTLGDMMPLRNENRILVRKGLEKLSREPRRGLQRLLEKLGLFGKTMEAVDVGYRIAPSINATGRLGEPNKAVELLLAEDDAEVDRLAEEILALNRRRRELGERAWDRLLPAARRSYEELESKFILIRDEEVHRGITGLLAGRLARSFNVPAAVVTAFDDRAVGSIRSVRGLGATELLGRVESMLSDWGGHDAAAGFSLPAEGLPAFVDRLSEVVREVELEEEEEPRIRVDAELPLDYVTPELEQIVRRFSPFGQENPQLTFLVRGAVLEELTLMGREETHCRLLLQTGKYRWPAVYWNAADRVNVDFSLHDEVDVLFELGWNFYQNRERVQLVVLDMKRAEG
ncbi:MAG: single-stranded-DNA-specific exonuclease RecJ [Spirochaetaceae bacterium]